ncbi:microfibril-associated glycoprotein 4-like [Argopecten irradians]|uniref:microfibril-associated glycoprotein 4-like n=1 Tax=Argopecten irradians TaxID=31199 RepID=UPI003714A666
MVQVVFALVLLVSRAVAVVALDDQKYTCIPRDCEDVRDAGNTESGVYTIYINRKNAVRVWCDMETDGGGWTVFQTRVNGSTDFYRKWDDYSLGFGNLNHEFWLGNQYLHHLTSSDWYSLRIYVEDFENETRLANYNVFTVANAEDGYRLFVTGYTGDAGDGLVISSGNRFSAKDKDLDTWAQNCAQKFHGAWWYKDCHKSNLNGKYLSGPTTTFANGVVWYQFKGHHYSLKSSKMMIRRGWSLLQGATANP